MVDAAIVELAPADGGVVGFYRVAIVGALAFCLFALHAENVMVVINGEDASAIQWPVAYVAFLDLKKSVPYFTFPPD